MTADRVCIRVHFQPWRVKIKTGHVPGAGIPPIRDCTGLNNLYNFTDNNRLMKIRLTSVLVDDQEKALKFYTEILGFAKKWDLPIGGGARFLTVVSPEEPDGTELLLEPNDNPVLNGAAQAYQRSLYTAGIPLAAFIVEDIAAEYERMKALGVVFSTEPTKLGMVTLAVFDDTCGNFIQIFQPMQPGL